MAVQKCTKQYLHVCAEYIGITNEATLDKCVGRYSKCTGFWDFLEKLSYRICNAVKAIFGCSDWQKAEKLLTHSLITHLKGLSHPLKEGNTLDKTARAWAKAFLEQLIASNERETALSSLSPEDRKAKMDSEKLKEKIIKEVDEAYRKEFDVPPAVDLQAVKAQEAADKAAKLKEHKDRADQVQKEMEERKAAKAAAKAKADADASLATDPVVPAPAAAANSASAPATVPTAPSTTTSVVPTVNSASATPAAPAAASAAPANVAATTTESFTQEQGKALAEALAANHSIQPVDLSNASVSTTTNAAPAPAAAPIGETALTLT